MVKVARSSRGSRDGGVERVGNLAHFEHKRTFLTWIIPYFHYNQGGSNQSRGLGLSPLPLTLTIVLTRCTGHRGQTLKWLKSTSRPREW